MTQAAVAHIMRLAEPAIATRGAFHIALAGGNTPRECYRQLTLESGQNWSRWHVWFGDERCVPPDDSQSNYQMARETLLDRIPIPREQIHPMYPDPTLSPEVAANRYADSLCAHAPLAREFPSLDLILLGLGPDGHTASLFPDTTVLQERHRWVAENYVPEFDSWRITLTFPVLDNARHLMFLVEGRNKAESLAHIERGLRPGELLLPVEMLNPQEQPEWFITSQ